MNVLFENFAFLMSNSRDSILKNLCGAPGLCVEAIAER